MHTTTTLLAAVLAAAPAACFAPVGLAPLRGARAAAGPLRMYAEGMGEGGMPVAASSLSRRVFFRDAVAVSSAALTIGSLGLEVPQVHADGLPQVSAPAPAFSLPSNAGGHVTLADMKGKWSVLYFYPGDFTSGCTIQARNFEKGATAIRGLGAEIFGISVNSIEKHLDFGNKHGLSFSLLSDSGAKVSDAYGSARKLPFMGTISNRQTYLIDPAGTLRWVFTDVESRLDKHVDEVTSKLKELQLKHGRRPDLM